MTLVEATVARWREAAQDLGFKFVAPFTLNDGADALSYLAWLPQFGSDYGMVIISEDFGDAQDRLVRVAKARGFGYSCMDPHDEPYDRDIIIEVLNDWDWTSSEPAPPWYNAPLESDAEI